MMSSVENIVRVALAKFIRSAAGATEEGGFFYSIQGDCEWSLCVLTMLPVDWNAAVLLSANLVKTTNKKVGGCNVSCSEDKWKKFLTDYDLWSFGDPGIAEITFSRLAMDGFK